MRHVEIFDREVKPAVNHISVYNVKRKKQHKGSGQSGKNLAEEVYTSSEILYSYIYKNLS